MSTEGRCNCGSITVTLSSPVKESVLCYCANCRRSSGAVCSANLVVDLSALEIKDSKNTLKEYKDDDTASGNHITRRFCGNCGSAIGTVTPALPGKIFLKAGLFEDIPAPTKEVFSQNKPAWAKPIDGCETL